MNSTTPTIDEKASSVWARILPFLRPIEALLQDPEISDIMVNGSQAVFVEKKGRMALVAGVTIDEKFLQVAARNIARALGADISEENPILDSRLPDGSRVAIVLPQVSVLGPALTIRKFQTKRLNAQELVRVGMFSHGALALLQQAVRDHHNVLISGGTGTGKTTLLNALAAFVSDDERIVIIEDTSEIQVQTPNLIRLEARAAQADLPAVTIRQLLKATLRLRPDRILLGEVRGSEAFDLLQALNTGHSGTLSTIHANSAAQSLTRFATCVAQSDVEMPHSVTRANIGEAIDLLVHLARRNGKRVVTEILRVKNYDTQKDRYELETLYVEGPGQQENVKHAR